MMYGMADRKFQRPPRPIAGKYVVYDPPEAGLPYVAVLFMPGSRPKAFIFDTEEEAVLSLTSNALQELRD